MNRRMPKRKALVEFQPQEIEPGVGLNFGKQVAVTGIRLVGGRVQLKLWGTAEATHLPAVREGEEIPVIPLSQSQVSEWPI